MPALCAACSADAICDRDPHRAAHRQPTDAIDLVGQQRALEVLEHDVRHVVVREPHVRRLDDVRVTERAGGTRFVHEALDHVRVGRELGMQDLDRDAALDQRVLREEHRAHPAFAQGSYDPIATLDDVPGLHHCFPRRSSAHYLHRGSSVRVRHKDSLWHSSCGFPTTMYAFGAAMTTKRETPFAALEKLRDQLPVGKLARRKPDARRRERPRARGRAAREANSDAAKK